MKIGIMNADFDEDHSTNCGYILQKILLDHYIESSVINYWNNESVREVRDYNGFIITGSWASYNDSHEWIDNIRTTLDEIREYDIPCLGICFGMQVIGDYLGGNVQNNVRQEKGMHRIDVNPESRLLRNLGNSFYAYESHSDFVIDLPQGALLSASNNYSNDRSVQGFEINNFYCVQFHPEFHRSVLERMAQNDSKSLSDIMGHECDANLPLQVIDNYIDIVRGF